MSGARIAAGALILAAGLGPLCADDPEPVRLPLTIEHVWFRSEPGKAWIRIAHSAGDLTIGKERLAFSTRKKTVELPVERIRMVTFGKIKGDVDTDWALLDVGDERSATVVAIRDGSKFGYGQRTREIYERLRAALESIPAAQYRVGRGFRAFDDFNLQFTMAVPESWESYLESVVFVGERAPWGTVLFSSEPIRRTAEDGGPLTADRDALGRVLDGTVPAFFVVRRAAERGMGCNGFSAKGLERLLGLAAEGSLFPGGGTFVRIPSTAPETLDHCNALRMRGTVASRKGVETEVDLHVAAEGGTLFAFGLRAVAERYDEVRETLEAVLATVQFSVAE